MKPAGPVSIAGVNVAAITPRRNGQEMDLGATLELIDFLCASGVQGIALQGSTGEFLNLSSDERTRMLYMGIKRSRVPVLAGVAHSSLDGAVELAREAASAGAAGLLLMPPYFFRYSQPDIRQFFLEFAALVAGRAPIYLYNIPFFTNELAVETAVELLQSGRFAGIKDSSGRFEYFARVRELPVTVLVGNDVVFTRARSAGADGVVSGVACALPELMVALDRAILCRDTPRVDLLERRLQEFIAWIDRFPAPLGVKTAVAARGLKIGPPTLPLAPENQRQLDEFREWFKPWLPALKKEIGNA